MVERFNLLQSGFFLTIFQLIGSSDFERQHLEFFFQVFNRRNGPDLFLFKKMTFKCYFISGLIPNPTSRCHGATLPDLFTLTPPFFGIQRLSLPLCPPPSHLSPAQSPGPHSTSALGVCDACLPPAAHSPGPESPGSVRGRCCRSHRPGHCTPPPLYCSRPSCGCCGH